MTIEGYLHDKFGYNRTVRNKLKKSVSVWRSWYKGYNQDFHKYKIYNGESEIELKRKSLQMAKKCCEDWADILFNVNCKISLSEDASTEELNKLLSKNNFWLLINQSIEKSFALGTGAVVVSVNGLGLTENMNIIGDSSELALEFIEVDKIYPISWDSGKITECAFVSSKTIKGKNYSILSVHYLQPNKNYAIHNAIFEMTPSGHIKDPGNDIKQEFNYFNDFDTHSPKRWFCIISPAVANNITDSETDGVNPYGISIFANAIDCLKVIDESFDSLSNEIVMGRKRIFVYEDMLKTIDGHRVFDSTDVSIYILPTGFSQDQLLQSENSPLRVSEIVSALESALSAFANNVGMGRQTYDFSISNMSTAAQVYSVNSELKRKRDKHITKIENELFDLIDALCYAATEFSHYNINSDGLSIIFDDSIFEDKESESERKLREVDAGVASRAEYRSDIFGEDEFTSKNKIREIDLENQGSINGDANEF